MDKTKMAVELFDKLAELYQEKYMNLDLYDDTYDFLCGLLPENAHILELACGPGNITRYLLKKRPDFQVLGTDLAPKMLELARINNPGTEFQMLDCREIGSLNQRFDAVVCGFCLPYLSRENAIQVIQDASEALNENGVLYLSAIEDDYSKSGMTSSSTGDQVYMYYHQADDLTQALTQNGFKVINLQRKDFTSHDGTQTIHLVIVSQKI